MVEHKTVAVDFDGTIAGYDNGWQGKPAEDPTRGAANALRALVTKGYTIVVFSCRASDPDGVKQIRDWLMAHNMLQYVSEVTNVKPRAVAYVDDKAVGFRGDWLAAIKGVDALADRQKGKTHDGAPRLHP